MATARKPKPRAKKGPSPSLSNASLFSAISETKQTKGDLRREKILRAVIECVSTIGIEKTNFETVGKTAKMLRAHVAYYYPDRDDMIRAALYYVIANGQAVTVRYLREAKTPRDHLRGFVLGTFAWLEEFPQHVCFMVLLYYYGTISEAYRRMNDEIRTMGRERIAVALGALRPEATARDLQRKARAIHGLITGYLIEYFSTENRESYASLRQHMLQDVEALAGVALERPE